MKPNKTWKDLQHGDVINCGAGTKGTVIDVLPHSAFIRFNTYDEVEEWYSFDDLKLRGWQIVQPQEEEKELCCHDLTYKQCTSCLDF